MSVFKEIRLYLLIAGALGISYGAYKKFTAPETMSLELTRKILQEIKHQLLIVTVNFADGISKHVKKNGMDGMQADKINQYFITELAKIYDQKEDLIINKYGITKGCYNLSLQQYKRDSQIISNQKQILDMMQRAVSGQTPDLKVHKTASQSFSKEQIRKIYLNMCKLVSTKVTQKLKEEKADDPYFDPNDSTSFRKVIRKLSIYDMKVEYLKKNGFKEQWGCPNQVFFKMSEYHKLNDPEFKEVMVRIEKSYEKVIEVASNDPDSIQLYEIDGYFNEKKGDVRISRSMNADPAQQHEEVGAKKFAKSFSAENHKNQDESASNILEGINEESKTESRIQENMKLDQNQQKQQVPQPQQQPKQILQKVEAPVHQVPQQQQKLAQLQPEKPQQQPQQGEQMQQQQKPEQVQAQKQEEQVQQQQKPEQVQAQKQEEQVQQQQKPEQVQAQKQEEQVQQQQKPEQVQAQKQEEQVQQQAKKEDIEQDEVEKGKAQQQVSIQPKQSQEQASEKEGDVVGQQAEQSQNKQ